MTPSRCFALLSVTFDERFVENVPFRFPGVVISIPVFPFNEIFNSTLETTIVNGSESDAGDLPFVFVAWAAVPRCTFYWLLLLASYWLISSPLFSCWRTWPIGDVLLQDVHTPPHWGIVSVCRRGKKSDWSFLSTHLDPQRRDGARCIYLLTEQKKIHYIEHFSWTARRRFSKGRSPKCRFHMNPIRWVFRRETCWSIWALLFIFIHSHKFSMFWVCVEVRGSTKLW